MAGVEQLVDMLHGVQGAAVWPIGVLFRRQVGLEDRSEHQHSSHLCHAVFDRGHAQRSSFPIRLGYVHPPHGLWSIGSTLQLLRQFVEPSLRAILLDVLKRLVVYSWCSAIGFAAFVGKLQHIRPNETKTRVSRLPEEKFDFLGYTFGRCCSSKTGRTYIGTVPSKKRVSRICETISAMTGRDQTLLDQEVLVGKLNRMMIGWANYFCLGPVSKAYRAVDTHACKRLRQWVCAKHKVLGPGTKRFPEASLHQRLGLVRLVARTSSFPWATS